MSSPHSGALICNGSPPGPNLTVIGPVRYEVVEPLKKDTGFHLGAGLYFGFDGHYHGG
jgi:hypothetical protein